jgi:ribonuclease D
MMPDDATDLPLAGPAVTFVDDEAAAAAALREVAADVVGVDVERADADRYYRRAALVQVGIADRCVLLDAVAMPQLAELQTFLHGRRVVLHALENDLGPLADKGVTPAQLEDTAVAAAILGLPTGLGSLLRDVLGVELEGDKSAYQRADWELRPLSAGMAAYAAGDVVHLPALWEGLATRLEETGRTDWYREELAHVVAHVDADVRDWQRVKGAGRLSPEQRAVLRALWEERERIAREHDIAPNRLVHEDVLRDLASQPPRSTGDLVRRSHRRRSLLKRHAPALLEAIARGMEAEPEGRDRSRRWSDRDRELFDALRRRRSEVADELGLDPGVLCPSKALWAPIGADLADGVELCRAAGLRRWQTELLADALWETYEDVRRDESVDDAAAS